MNFLFLLFEISFLFNGYSCQIYTASSAIAKLLTTQSVLIHTLQEYIATTESKLKTLKAHLEIFKNEQEKANKDVEEYLGNPLNDFLLIKRLTLDWKDVENLVMDNTTSELVKKVTANESVIFPTDEDLHGAAEAISRLQEVYDLDISSFANGEILDKQTDVKLSAKDCFLIGKQFYKVKNYRFSRSWMEEALRRYNHEINKTVRKTDILGYLATTSYIRKDYKRIPEILNEISKNLSDEEKIQKNFTNFERDLLEIDNSSRKGDGGGFGWFYADPYIGYTITMVDKYKQLCRNEIGVREDIRAKLKCRYTDLGKAFLKLAKLKEEDMFLNPKIVVYHDVIFDEEIEVIKKLAKNSLERAEVVGETLVAEKVPYRIGQYSFLDDFLHPKLVKLSQRVEDLTGLTTETAEPYQVVDYGIGGQYTPHHDYMEVTNTERRIGRIWADKSHRGLKGGRCYRAIRVPEKLRYDLNPYPYYSERLATVIFYMNDVEFGGATVFPCLNVSVPAKKGTALIWYNLKLSGAYETRSLHGGCPVLKGFKWICNKWMGERGQALLRPCGLTKEAE